MTFGVVHKRPFAVDPATTVAISVKRNRKNHPRIVAKVLPNYGGA
jgi:hypothetical protein